jgi:ABC-type nitrate/sulfonate/bicarbonate transport system substrate-binding protein
VKHHGKITLSFRFLFALPLAYALLLPHPAHTQQARNIRVSIPSISHTPAALIIAKDKGYYKEENLEVELVLMPAALATQAVLSGAVQFSNVSGAGLPPILRGAPLRFVFSTFTRPAFWIFSRPDIRQIEDLKGKKIGASSPGAGPYALLRHLFRKHRLELGRDITNIAIGDSTGRLLALKAGSVDAAIFAPPYNFVAQEAGFRELASFIDQDIVEVGGSLIAHEQFIATDAATVERVLRGSLKGLFYLNERRAGTLRILARFLKVPEQRAAQIYDLVRPSLTKDGTVNELLQRRSAEHIVDLVGLKEMPPLGKVYNYSMAEKVRDELQAKGWKPTD